MFNFKCTVLVDYLWYGARTGTKMKLKRSTFWFSNLFCVGVFFRFQKLEKHDTHRPKEVQFRNLIHFGFTENVVKMLDKMLKIQNFTIR